MTAKPLEPGDADLLVTVGSLVEFGLELPEDYRRHESFKREQVTGGTIMIEYEFDAPDEDLPYIYSLAELHGSPRNACYSFNAGNLGVRLGRLELEDRDDLFRYGDKSRFAFVMREEDPVGNFFSMCRSRTAFLVMLAGFYFGDAELWRELVARPLRALEAFEAANP